MTTLIHVKSQGLTMPAELFGFKLSTLMWGLIGGATAALFGPSTWNHRVVTTAVGAVVTSALGPILVTLAHAYSAQYITLDRDDILPPVCFLCGLVGMWTCAILIEALKRLKTEGPDVISGLMSKLTGKAGKQE